MERCIPQGAKALHSGIAEKGDDRALYAGWMGADEIHQEKSVDRKVNSDGQF